jgi:hypothetical protein
VQAFARVRMSYQRQGALRSGFSCARSERLLAVLKNFC